MGGFSKWSIQAIYSITLLPFALWFVGVIGFELSELFCSLNMPILVLYVVYWLSLYSQK